VGAIFFGECLHVDGPSVGINNRCGSNSDLRENRASHVSCRYRRDSRRGICEGYLPKWGRGMAVCIECVHTGMFRCHVHDVMCTLSSNGHSWDVKRLPINVSIHAETEFLPKLRLINIRGGQYSLVHILSRTRVVILVSEHSAQLWHRGIYIYRGPGVGCMRAICCCNGVNRC